MKKYLTITEAAAELGLSRNTAYAEARRYRESGVGIPNFRVSRRGYRVPRSALAELADVGFEDGESA